MRLRRRVGLEPPPPVAAAGSRGHLSFEFGSPLRAQAPPGMSVRAPSISGIVAPTARVPASPFPLPRSGGGGKGQTQAEPNLLRPNQSSHYRRGDPWSGQRCDAMMRPAKGASISLCGEGTVRRGTVAGVG